MTSCKSKKTFMQAVKGDQIIDVTFITSAINKTDIDQQVSNFEPKLSI